MTVFALTCLLGSTTPILRAKEADDSFGKRHNVDQADTLVFVNAIIDDRPRFEAIIDKAYPRAKVLYSSIDPHRDHNISDQLLFGTREDVVKEIGHRTLVIISNYREATLQVGQMSYEDSLAMWNQMFTPAKGRPTVSLHLFSTDKTPPQDMLRLTHLSEGTYYKLTPNKDGSYQ